CDWYIELVKPRMSNAEEANLARQVLALALGHVLRLLHPCLPFVTEALWARLPEVAPERGIERAVPSSECLALAAWPDARPEWEEDALEQRIAFFQDVVRAIRDIRAKNNVAPSARVRAEIRAEGNSAFELRDLSALLTHIAGLEELSIGADLRRKKDAAVAVVRDVEVYIPGVIDLET